MAKISWSISLMLLVVCGWCADTCLGASIGAPKAAGKRGLWSAGGEYFFEQMDLGASGMVTAFAQSEGEWVPVPEVLPPYQADWTIDSLKMNMLCANFWYGVTKNVDVLVRLGAADAKDEIATGELPDSPIQAGYSLDGGYGFAAGIGARANLWQHGAWKIGGVGQITWFTPGNSSFSFSPDENPDQTDSGSIDLDLWQGQIAVGIARDVNSVCVYGGPFVQWTGGKLNLESVTYLAGEPTLRYVCEHDIDAETTFGIFIGASGKVRGRVCWYAEGQFTGDSYGLGIGAAYKKK